MKDKYSVFVSHSSEDKIEYVDDLVEEIKRLGISVFYVVGNQDNYVVMQNLTPL